MPNTSSKTRKNTETKKPKDTKKFRWLFICARCSFPMWDKAAFAVCDNCGYRVFNAKVYLI